MSTHVTGCGEYGLQSLKVVPPLNQTPVTVQKERDIMTPEDVCEFLGIDSDTLSAMIRGYQIPVIRLKKGLHRFSRRQIETWLDEKATQRGNEDD